MAEPGRQIGPYRLLTRVGSGAMGEVWRARDQRLDRLVAVKLLPSAAAGDPEKRARMLREAKASAAVPHPNVVTLFDVVSEGGDDVLVMELVEGRTLAERIRDAGPLSIPEALEALDSMADALATAHARGILHRDIKTSNIMVGQRGEIKVLDFGLAKLRTADELETADTGNALPLTTEQSSEVIALGETVSSSESPQYLQTLAGSLIGTPLYMAPEQLKGAQPDERSEVYSLGVVAFEMLVGKPPYRARSFEQLIAEVGSGEINLERVPASLRPLLERSLAREPSERFASMNELRDQVRALRGELATPRLRKLLPLLCGAAVLLAAGVGIALYTALKPDPPAPVRPGDRYIEQALREYNLFYGKKARSSLLGAVKTDPDHPLAYAYLLLFDVEEKEERDAQLARANAVLAGLPADEARNHALLAAAIAMVEKGPREARRILLDASVELDPELRFWASELAFRAGDYAAAEAGYQTLLDGGGADAFRGRIYDHASALLLYSGKPAQAEKIGRLYAEAFPGEPDAIGVYATTLAANGKYDAALAQAREAVNLHDGEDTLAGLAKVHAYRGEFEQARKLYERSLAAAPPNRQPVRRAALAFLYLLDDDREAASEVVEPCLPGGTDASRRERGACLFVAGLVNPERIPNIVAELHHLQSEATELAPAYGAPEALARLLEARMRFAGGGCIEAPASPTATLAADEAARVDRLLTDSGDFFAAYHVPFFSLYALCERAAVARASGNAERAAAELEKHIAVLPSSQLLLLELSRAQKSFAPDKARDSIRRFLAGWPTLDSDAAVRDRAK